MALNRKLAFGVSGCAAVVVAGVAVFATLSLWREPVRPPTAPASQIIELPPVAAVPQVAAPVALPAEPPAWRRFAVPTPVTDLPLVVIVIDDMGVDRHRSLRAAALPAPLTLSYLPYAEHVAVDAAAARARGHELLLHLPMEPVSRSEDPGPHALFTGGSTDDLLQRLDWNLARFDGYVGANNHMGSRFTADRAAMTPVLNRIAARGLMWLDSRTTGATVAPAVAAAQSVPLATRDVFLDHDPSAANVAAQLHLLEAIARRKGIAVAIGHPRDATLSALEQWLPQLAAKGLVLAPLTAAVNYGDFGG